jgi:inosine-uridine nucleoside N-ribohydrolase
MMKERKVILDMDPGIDDALAIILALRSLEVRVMGITTVVGNAPVELCTINTLRILEYLKATGIPVIEGMGKPLRQPFAGALGYHGADGLGEIDLPLPKFHKQPVKIWDFIAESVSKYPGEITLVATGPLTNIATVLQRVPSLATSLSQIVIMGGAYGLTKYGKGNRTPFAEFNIWQDPEAASIVFNSEASIFVVGLDVSNNPEASLTKNHLEQIQKYINPYSCLSAKLIKYILNSHKYCELHDPLALAAVLDISLFDFISTPIAVSTGNGWDRGTTHIIPELQGKDILPKNIAKAIDGERFIELFLSRIRDI